MTQRIAFLLFILGATLAAPAPAIARSHPAPLASHHHLQSTTNSMNARIASLNARIAMLRERGIISSEAALELRNQSRGLTRRLHGMSERDLRDLEFGLDRLENRVRYAMDDASFAHHIDDGPRHIENDRAERDRRNSDYEHFDRYTGSSVDRWHDPFDRGEPR